MNILIINGPNLNFLGIREPEIYGDLTYNDLVNYLLDYSKEAEVSIEVYQSSHEGEIIDIIQDNYLRFQGLVINPAALTHYSYALYDCIKSVPLPTVEVHLSDITKREPFRNNSVIKPACIEQISGKGFQSYTEAIDLLKRGHKES